LLSESLFSHTDQCVVPSQAKRRTVHVHHGAIAPAAGHVRPQRLAVAVREVARVRGELVDRREVVARHCIPHPHRRQRIVAAQREVLSHALDEPQGQRVEPLQPGRFRVLRDVVLEDVHEFVAEHVVIVGVAAGEGHHDARAQPFRHAPRALVGRIAHDVRLLEVRVIGVEHDRMPLELVAEGVRVSRIPALGHPAGIARDQRLRRVEVQVEVIRLQDPEVELLVLHLVAPEVLGRGLPRATQDKEGEAKRRAAQERSHH
jgi:hypothetical protein